MEERSLLDLMLDWENGELSKEDEILLFQRLVDNGMAWNLQGMYGRHAKALIDAGLVKANDRTGQ